MVNIYFQYGLYSSRPKASTCLFTSIRLPNYVTFTDGQWTVDGSADAWWMHSWLVLLNNSVCKQNRPMSRTHVIHGQLKCLVEVSWLLLMTYTCSVSCHIVDDLELHVQELEKKLIIISTHYVITGQEFLHCHISSSDIW